MNGVDDVSERFLFHDVALCAGPKRAQRVERFIVHGENQNGQSWKFGADVFNQLNAVRARQANIDNRQVGFHFAQHVHGLRRGVCFATNAETVIGVDQLLETFAKERVIIDDDDSFRVNCFAFGSLRNGLTAFHFGSGR